MIQNKNKNIIPLLVILLSFTLSLNAQNYNVNGTYTMYQNQDGNCVEVPENVCTPCTIGQTTYYYSLDTFFNPDFPINVYKYSDSQCTNLISSNERAYHTECSPKKTSCAIFYRLTEIDFAELTISSEELMYVGLVPYYSQNDVKIIANTNQVIANGTVSGFQAYSNDVFFRYVNRLSETRYNTTVGECNYDEICTYYPFTYTMSIVSRETKIPSDKIFITFTSVYVFTITDTDEEYVINSRLSDEVFDPALEFVLDKGDVIPTTFPGLTFFNPPKTGEHFQQISELELTPQENGAYYYLKYTLDWYNTFPYISNCTVTGRREQFNNEYIICELPVRSVEFPDDFDNEKIAQNQNPDDMSFQLF